MTARVDYDSIAGEYSSRYSRNDYSGVTAVLAEFCATGLASDRIPILEVGCGTGHWLEAVRELGGRAVGIDISSRMLNVAQASEAPALLARAQAEAMPFRSESFDRIFCINALHHFTNPEQFFMEAKRVARPGGALLTIGLDPHTGRDEWWIYDYFPEALIADRRRYLPAHAIRTMMAGAGFDRCETREVQHLPRQLRVGEAERLGFLGRTSTSQLMVISDEAYRSGLARIHAAASTSGDLLLRAHLRLYGTSGWRAV